ncbi:30S ribosome-binding factor RbfA [Marivibrio halodurans]|uniref:Ribosome-binding factor A n=1 Tax=Marivibrio halodurans TaxID=2039722 RepID=A0A8J7SPL4_9PROT|nr:30S ribosome-binding factor RbfA [Marivibrio halodurans]MBP5858708.1 30S ribosome-binding factor RbfA [Marivibrio halodurans]
MTARAPSQRQLRVGEEVRHALAQVMQRGELRDPALAGVSVTVSEVRVSPDLKNATCFVTPLGASAGREEVAEDEVVRALQRAAAFLRGQVAREVRLKFTPALRFRVDDSFDEAARIDELLKRPEVARDLEGGTPPDDDRD